MKEGTRKRENAKELKEREWKRYCRTDVAAVSLCLCLRLRMAEEGLAEEGGGMGGGER
ncbi:MAG: hypothetical protein LBJ20_00555 [Candidatus Methanoplasma sp.]|nr:hypothetical protein [Candidatus Methanoplasma sp.]